MRLLLKITLSFILLLGVSTSIFSQKMTLSGYVVSGKTQLKYSNIGILNSSFGTVSKNDGSFFLEIPNSYRDSLIVFSSVGYISDTIKIKDIALDRAIIDLKEDIFQLNEVEIKGDKYKNKIIGKKKIPFYFVSHPIEEDKPEFEYGNIFEIYNDTRLNNYSFYIIAYSKFSEVTFKLSIYNVKDNVPDKILNHTNIIYKTTTVGWQNIDLDSYNIQLNGLDKIAVVLQLVDFKKEEGENFTFGIPVTISSKNKLLYRSHSQLNWEQKEGVFLSNINVDYIKGKKEKEVKPDEDELLEIEWNKINKYHEEKKHIAYGNDSTSGNYIELEKCKIYYEVYGEGKPLLLLHGNSCSIVDFYKQIPILSKQYKVIAIDTRGHGKSIDYSTGSYRYELFAEDLYHVINKLKLKKVNILGWSDGGITGLIFNLNYSKMVNKLVIVGANLTPDAIDDNTKTLIKLRAKGAESKSEKRLVQLILTQPHIDPNSLTKISNEVLVVAGEKDVIKEEHTRLISTMIKNAKLSIIPNSSHYAPWENPIYFNKIINEFLLE